MHVYTSTPALVGCIANNLCPTQQFALFTMIKCGKIALRVSQIRLYGVVLLHYALPDRIAVLSGGTPWNPILLNKPLLLYHTPFFAASY